MSLSAGRCGDGSGEALAAWDGPALPMPWQCFNAACMHCFCLVQQPSIEAMACLNPAHSAERLGSPAAGAAGLQLVWTTVEEVRSSLEGWFAGNSIPGPEKNVGKPFLQTYWHRWVGGYRYTMMYRIMQEC